MTLKEEFATRNFSMLYEREREREISGGRGEGGGGRWWNRPSCPPVIDMGPNVR